MDRRPFSNLVTEIRDGNFISAELKEKVKSCASVWIQFLTHYSLKKWADVVLKVFSALHYRIMMLGGFFCGVFFCHPI